MMPVFSARSMTNLLTCDRRLQSILEDVILTYDFTVLEGHRSDERQEALFHEGKSKLRAGESKHNSNPSLAVDIAPYPIDWENAKRFYLLAGFVFQAAADQGVVLRWGGDWDGDWDHADQSFNDLPHFEVLM